MYLPVDTARAEASRKHQHVVIAGKACFYHQRKVAPLLARLVDRNAERCQARKVHQQIVDEITEAAVVMTTNDST